MNVSSGYMKYGFDAYGDSVLRAEHMAYWMNDPMRTDPKGISFELGNSIEEVENNFFFLVPTINELIIKNPECNVVMSDESIALFINNDVLIRGEFNTAAERFAKEYGLKFLHTNVELGYDGEYYSAAGIDSVDLRFNKDGSAVLHLNNFCPGSSGGWSGGGEITDELPMDFYKTMTFEEVAARGWSSCREMIISNGILKGLLENAKAKGGFLIDYSKQ